MKLPPSGKEYLCFHNDGKTSHSDQCDKSRSFTKVIYLILGIELFEKQFFILKDLLHSDRLKQHIVTIVIDPLLSNSEMYEHRCMKNINKLYTSSGKCNDQHHYKFIIELAMVSTPDIFTDKGSMSPGPYMDVRNPSAIKLLRLFTEVLDVNNKTSVRRLGSAKSGYKSIRSGIMVW